jgi:iron complex outermembrane receptor protein
MLQKLMLATAALATPLTLMPLTAAAQSGGGLEEVVVTAERREASLQDVPVAVTALSMDWKTIRSPNPRI